jgi:hypothetical protein
VRFFPLLTDDFPEQVALLRTEHRHVEQVLNAAATATPVDPAWPDAFIEVLHELRTHILKEQDGVFPAALTTIDSDGWDQIDAVRAGIRIPPVEVRSNREQAAVRMRWAAQAQNP